MIVATSMNKQILAVLLCGGIGSLLRFAISFWVQYLTQNSFFPWGLLIVNLLGCLIVGIIVGLLFEHYSLGTVWRAAIITGLLGGFTSMSSFSLDTITLFLASEYFSAIANIILNLFGSLLATFVGLGLVRILL